MSWLKLSDDYGDECARAGLSDAAFRTHTEALGWVMRRETGGYIDRIAVRRFAETREPDAAIEELLTAGFWHQRGDGYVVVHHMEHQPEPDVIAKRRSDNADRKRRERRRSAGVTP